MWKHHLCHVHSSQKQVLFLKKKLQRRRTGGTVNINALHWQGLLCFWHWWKLTRQEAKQVLPPHPLLPLPPPQPLDGFVSTPPLYDITQWEILVRPTKAGRTWRERLETKPALSRSHPIPSQCVLWLMLLGTWRALEGEARSGSHPWLLRRLTPDLNYCEPTPHTLPQPPTHKHTPFSRSAMVSLIDAWDTTVLCGHDSVGW